MKDILKTKIENTPDDDVASLKNLITEQGKQIESLHNFVKNLDEQIALISEFVGNCGDQIVSLQKLMNELLHMIFDANEELSEASQRTDCENRN